MKLKHFALLVLAVLAGFTSCKENNKGNEGGDPVVSIIGTWAYTDMTYEFEAEDSQTVTTLNMLFAITKEAIESGTIEFDDNGVYKWTITSMGESQTTTGTYTYENGQLMVDGEENPCELTETQLKMLLPVEDLISSLSSLIDPSTVTKSEVFIFFERAQQE